MVYGIRAWGLGIGVYGGRGGGGLKSVDLCSKQSTARTKAFSCLGVSQNVGNLRHRRIS